MVLYGTTTAGTTPVLPGLVDTNVNVAVTFANGIPSIMTVSISGYTINSIFASNTLTRNLRSLIHTRGSGHRYEDN